MQRLDAPLAPVYIRHRDTAPALPPLDLVGRLVGDSLLYVIVCIFLGVVLFSALNTL